MKRGRPVDPDSINSRLRFRQEFMRGFWSRAGANAFQRSVGSTSYRVGVKIRCKTYTTVDPDTNLAFFIVHVQYPDSSTDGDTHE